MKTRKRILLTGASGTVGKAVLKELCTIKNKYEAKFITAYVADGTNGKGEKAIDLIRSSEKW